MLKQGSTFTTANGNLFLEKIPLLLCCSILVTLPFMKLNNVLSMVLTAYALYVGWRDGYAIDKKDWQLFLPTLLLALYLIGLCWSVDFVKAWKQVEKILPFAAFPLSFYLLRHRLNKADVEVILYTWVFLCVAFSIICYVNAVHNIIEHDSFVVTEQKEREYYYYSYLYLVEPVGIDPIYLSLYVNFAIVTLVVRPFKNTLLNVALIVYLVFFNVLISSKIGVIALCLVGFFYLLYRIQNKYIAVGTVVAAMLVLGVTIRTSSFLSSRFLLATSYQFDAAYAGEWNSVSQRLAIWKCAFETVQDVFPLGYGTANGQHKLREKYVKYNYIRGIEDNYNAHSEYLFTLLDIGVFGLTVLVLIVVLPLVRSFQAGNHLLFCLQCFLVIYFAVEVILARRFGIFFYSFFYPLLFVYGIAGSAKSR